MRMKLTTGSAVLVLCLALPACSSIFGGHQIARAGPEALPEASPEAAVANAPAAIAVNTDSGRQNLDGLRNGLAIENFQAALASGEPAAPVFNGLGVAFARIGRFEQSENYFRLAMALAPKNGRYADNLSKLMLSPAFAMRHDGDRLRTMLAESKPAPGALPVAELAAALPIPSGRLAPSGKPSPSGRLERTGPNQFHVQSIQPMAAPARMAAAHGLQGFKPLLRFGLAPATFSSSPLSREGVAAQTAGSEPKGGEAKFVSFKPLVRLDLPAIRR